MNELKDIEIIQLQSRVMSCLITLALASFQTLPETGKVRNHIEFDSPPSSPSNLILSQQVPSSLHSTHDSTADIHLTPSRQYFKPSDQMDL